MKERILSPNIYNIPGSIPFSTALVSGILSGEIFDGDFNDPLMLNKILIFVPTRRASRNIHESFIASCKNKGTILPRIIPIGVLIEPKLFVFSITN